MSGSQLSAFICSCIKKKPAVITVSQFAFLAAVQTCIIYTHPVSLFPPLSLPNYLCFSNYVQTPICFFTTLNTVLIKNVLHNLLTVLNI